MGKILKNKILAGLPEAEFARLMPFLEPVSLASGRRLNAPGDPWWFVYFPENCVHSCQVHMEDGRSAEVAMVGFEGVADILALIHSRSTVYSQSVLIGGDAFRVRKDHFEREIPRIGGLQQLLLDYSAAFITQLSQRSACVHFHLLEQRLAVWLLLLADRMGDDVMQITHEQTAQFIGVRRAGVTVAALQMQEAGAINYKRGRLRIDNRKTLEKFACECYETLALTRPHQTTEASLETPALIKEQKHSSSLRTSNGINRRVWADSDDPRRRVHETGDGRI